MPAPKKAGSARRSPANKTETTTAEPEVKLNKDGTPRKKPGPRKGSARGTAKTAATGTRRRNGTRAKKKFLLYAVDGNELSFICESDGATGQIAVTNAVKAGTVAPDTPIVPLAPRAVQRVVEVEAVERDVQYKVKTGTAKRKYTRRAKPVEPEVDTAGDDAPVEPVVSARKSARKAAPTPPAPGEKSANPFA